MPPSTLPYRDASPAGTPAAVEAPAIAAIGAFQDNYIWLLHRGGRAVVVDPGDAAPVERALAERGLHLESILITHHHGDHVGGVKALVRQHGAQVWGPAASAFDAIDTRVREGDVVQVLGQSLRVLETPGHTLDHIAYWCAGMGALFCGDTLFAGGCGRIFEGTAPQMFASLAKLAALPGTARVYCAHEYTLSNLRFAMAVEPDNVALQQRQRDCAALRTRGEPTVPSSMALEQATNPFLRAHVEGVQAAARRQRPGLAADPAAVFAVLRAWKDGF